MREPGRKYNGKKAENRFQAEEFVPYLLRRVSARLAKSLGEALKPFGHSPNFWRVLVALETRERPSISELSAMTIIDQSTLSRTLDRMEEQGYVRRTPGSQDARNVEVGCTDAGRRAFRQILPVASAQYEWAIRRIPEQDLAVLKRTLQRMLRNIRFSPIK